MSNAATPNSFEEAVTKLEEIVTALESGNLPLDECLSRFETAVGLSRFCAARLESAEKQIRILSGEGEPAPASGLPWASEVPPASPPTKREQTPDTTAIQSNFDWDA